MDASVTLHAVLSFALTSQLAGAGGALHAPL